MYSYLVYLVRHWEQRFDTAIGAWFGGVGAIPGAIIGGAVGGICGSFGASWLGVGTVDMIYGR